MSYKKLLKGFIDIVDSGGTSILIKKERSVNGGSSEVKHDYLKYVRDLKPGHAGRISLDSVKSKKAAIGMLESAARSEGKTLTIKQIDDELIFWV